VVSRRAADARLGAIAVAAVLAGCSGEPDPAPPCPTPAIVDGLASANFGRTTVTTDDPREIAWRGTIIGFDGGCVFNRSGVLLRYTIDLAGVAGPAFDGRTMTFPYFVAVADPAGTVIAKEVFQVVLPQPQGREAVGARDAIEQTIQGVAPADGRSWRIYLGIDLPPDAVTPPPR
jgi:hypothetical protein